MLEQAYQAKEIDIKEKDLAVSACMYVTLIKVITVAKGHIVKLDGHLVDYTTIKSNLFLPISVFLLLFAGES